MKRIMCWLFGCYWTQSARGERPVCARYGAPMPGGY
jgi:hypothetical protein